MKPFQKLLKSRKPNRTAVTVRPSQTTPFKIALSKNLQAPKKSETKIQVK